MMINLFLPDDPVLSPMIERQSRLARRHDNGGQGSDIEVCAEDCRNWKETLFGHAVANPGNSRNCGLLHESIELESAI